MLMSLAFLVSAIVQFALGLLVAWLLPPEHFAFYALALAGASLLQTGLFEWLRLGVTRFSGGTSGTWPSLASPIFQLMLAIALFLALAAFAWGRERAWLFALVPLLAGLMGFAEIRAAARRASFDERAYARGLLWRNGASILLVPLAASLFRNAEAALIAYGLCVAIGIFGLGRTPTAKDAAPPVALPVLFAYAAPIVATNFAYLALFFALRLYVAKVSGIAAAGAFSLALELGLKLITTLGSALDLWLFQRAIHDQTQHGEAAGQKRLGANAQWVLAVLAPAAFGLCFIAPDLQILLVAPSYHGWFAGALAAIMPGLLLYGAIQFALHPFFQLRAQTLPLAMAGLIALILSLALLPLLPASWSLGDVAAPIGPALACGFLAGGASLWLREAGKGFLTSAFLLKLFLAIAAMAAASGLVSVWLPGWPRLLAMIASCALTYAAAAFLLDLAGARQLARMLKR